MKFTDRDQRLLDLLLNYGMLTTHQMNVHVFGGIARTTMLRRLRLLEKLNYLTRIHRLDSQEHLWVLKPKGAMMADGPLPRRNWSKNMLPHDLKLLSLRIQLEASGLAHDWTPEHVIRYEIMFENAYKRVRHLLIPDGLMGVEMNGLTESIAVELELTQKCKTKLRKTLMSYHEQDEKSELKSPPPPPLTSHPQRC